MAAPALGSPDGIVGYGDYRQGPPTEAEIEQRFEEIKGYTHFD